MHRVGGVEGVGESFWKISETTPVRACGVQDIDYALLIRAKSFAQTTSMASNQSHNDKVMGLHPALKNRCTRNTNYRYSNTV